MKYPFRRDTTEYGFTQILKDGASRQRSSMLMKILLLFQAPFVSGLKRESTKHDFEFQSRLHECETNIAGGYSILLQMVGTHLCAGFFVAQNAG